MSDIMVRACHKCKVYVCIIPEDPSNLQALKIFDATHSRHMVQSVVLGEVQSIYQEVPCKTPLLPGPLLGAPSAGEASRGHA